MFNTHKMQLGNSLSLLGDAGAMSVDVLSYVGSIYGERAKARHPNGIPRCTKLCINVFIPALSLASLIAVTIYVTIQAFDVLKEGESGDDDLNVAYLYGFSSANMFVDVGKN